MGDLSPHFSRIEFACSGWTKGGGSCGCKNKGIRGVDFHLITILEHLRVESGKRVNVNSGFRCKTRNREVGGASNSQHLFGMAADIWVGDMDIDPLWTPNHVVSWIRHHHPKASHGAYNSFTHLDVRPGGPIFWDKRDRKGAFPPYTPPIDTAPISVVEGDSLEARVKVLEDKVAFNEDAISDLQGRIYSGKLP